LITRCLVVLNVKDYEEGNNTLIIQNKKDAIQRGGRRPDPKSRGRVEPRCLKHMNSK